LFKITTIPPTQDALVLATPLPKTPDNSNEVSIDDEDKVDSIIPFLNAILYLELNPIESFSNGNNGAFEIVASTENEVPISTGEGGGESYSRGGWGWSTYTEAPVVVETPVEVEIESPIQYAEYPDDVTISDMFCDEMETVAEIEQEIEVVVEQYLVQDNDSITEQTTQELEIESGLENQIEVEQDITQESDNELELEVENEQESESTNEFNSNTETSNESEIILEVETEQTTQDVEAINEINGDIETVENNEKEKDSAFINTPVTEMSEEEVEVLFDKIKLEATFYENQLVDRSDFVENEIEKLFNQYNDFPEIQARLQDHYFLAQDKLSIVFADFEQAFNDLDKAESLGSLSDYKEAVSQLRESINSLVPNATELMENLRTEYQTIIEQAHEMELAIIIAENQEYLTNIANEYGLENKEQLQEQLGLSFNDLCKLSETEIETILNQYELKLQAEVEYKEELKEFTDSIIAEAKEMDVTTDQLLAILEVKNIEEAFILGEDKVIEKIEGWIERQEELKEFNETIAQYAKELELTTEQLLSILEVTNLNQAFELSDKEINERVKRWEGEREKLLLEQKISFQEISTDIAEQIIEQRGNPDNVVAYDFDREGRLIFLEIGNMYLSKTGEKGAGFWHIENRHYAQFQKKFGDGSYQEVIDRVMDTVKNGECQVKIKDGKLSYNYTQNFTNVYVSDNGYIIGAGPRS
jgi:hypothetical protein